MRVSIQALTDVSGVHEGWTVRPSVAYARRFGQHVFARVEASATYASDSYMSTYFDLASTGAGAAGLRTSSPSVCQSPDDSELHTLCIRRESATL